MRGTRRLRIGGWGLAAAAIALGGSASAESAALQASSRGLLPSLTHAARAATAAGHSPVAHALWSAVAGVAHAARDPERAAFAWLAAARAISGPEARGEALVLLQVAEESLRPLPPGRALVEVLAARALVLGPAGRGEAASGDLARACSVAEGLATPRERYRALAGVADAYRQIGRGDLYPAVAERLLETARESGTPHLLAEALLNLGIARWERGATVEAEGLLLEALDRARAASLVATEGQALHVLGAVAAGRGEDRLALDRFAQAIQRLEAVGPSTHLVDAIAARASIAKGLGRLDEARDGYERALDLAERIGSLTTRVTVWANLAAARADLCDLPGAIAAAEQGLGLAGEAPLWALRASLHNTLGAVCAALGLLPDALAQGEKAVRCLESAGNPVEVARDAVSYLTNLAQTYALSGRPDDALAAGRRAFEAAGGRPDLRLHARLAETWVLSTTGAWGEVASKARQLEDALRVRAAPLELCEVLVLRGLAAQGLADWQGLRRVAEDLAEVAAKAALPDRERLARTFRGAALYHEGDLPGAIAAFRGAADATESIVAGQGDTLGARAREQHEVPFRLGLRAALEAGSAEDVFHFLETGRAAGLREGLGGRRALAVAVLPEPLRRAEADARLAEAKAAEALGLAQASGNRREARRLRKVLDAAHQDVLDAVDRVQREAHRAADVLRSTPIDLARARSGLATDEALVLLADLGRGEVAGLVVEASGARILVPRPAGEIEAWVGLLSQEGAEGERALADLRRHLTPWVGLRPDVRRVYVSPQGVLSFVPFGALWPEREVAWAPSATVLDLLRAEPGNGGTQVLALGDPAYGAGASPSAFARGRAALQPLPASRDEALAVGDEVLLGEEATEAGLAKLLPSRPRWRAIHLACHGILDREHPLRTCLALAADAEHDGLLTALEVFRMQVPADLVVLSACDTAQGKVYRSEGIVGLTRAFLFAGAPRVLCSLWKVDDEATAALMAHFYPLWAPKSGATPLPAAEALRRAQDFVRGQPRWSHPRYWAAWVLWGRP